MKRYLKKKKSKITVKKHSKHHPMNKDAVQEVNAGISSFSSTRIVVKREIKS